MPCARRLLSLQACAAFATGRPLLLQPCALFGFSAASSLPPRRPLVWKVLKRLTISILAQDKPRLTTVTKSPVEEQKDNQDSTTRIEDQDGILLSPGPKQSFGGHYSGVRKLRSNPQSVLESLDLLCSQIQSVLDDPVSRR